MILTAQNIDFDTRNKNWRLLNDSLVAKYRNVIAKRSAAGIDFRIRVSCVYIVVSLQSSPINNQNP